MTQRRLIVTTTVVVAALAATMTVFAQRGGGNRRESASSQSYSGNVRYDGKFVFVRMSYPFSGRGEPAWAHDYPVGETHFLKIFTALTNVSAHVDASSIMSFSDPEIFKFPVLYLVEPGCWYMSDTDVLSLRAYMQKGGFLIVDDFPQITRGCTPNTWGQFDMQMSRVFPEGQWIELTPDHPIFHTFYDIDSFDIIPQYYNLGGRPIFYGLFEDNNPAKRMYAIANYQSDLSEFWEHSETGLRMIEDTNQAYKLGINEFVYGITR
jgi:hypothetical protein